MSVKREQGVTTILANAPGLAGRNPQRDRQDGKSRARTAARWLVAALLAGAGTAAYAQPPMQTPADAPTAAEMEPKGAPVTADDIAFEADQIDYDYENEVVVATGNVRVARETDRLVADKVNWNRKTGKVIASGNVVIRNKTGDTVYTDDVEITEDLRDGVINNLLLVSSNDNRLAAEQGERKGAIYVLRHAAYTPCKVVDPDGCPKEPTWQVQAANVVYDSDRKTVRYRGARVNLLGFPLIPLPGLRHSVSGQGASGLMVPDINLDRRNGFEFSLPYYLRISENRDLTLTPHVFTAVLPMLEGEYRALLSRGAYQVTGYATVSTPTSLTDPTQSDGGQQFRGYISASGKFQFDEHWSLTGSARYVTDRTFLTRYDISREDRLRSTISLDRRDNDSYFSIAGWDFQSLRSLQPTGQIPIALPAIDYRRRIADPLLGGMIQLQANSLAIIRTEGQDTQRAFVGATWTKNMLTGFGQEVSFTGLLRGDVYHSAQNDLSPTVLYRGDPGWVTRSIAAAAVDMRWPFIGEALGGTQQIIPRVQLVLSPKLSNLNVPNEDSRAIDLDDSNLFALNRFPGYDRFEDSSRVTYGFDYRLDRPNFSVDATIGQSYRLDERQTLLPNGTGLSDRLSDIVGRAQVRYKDLVTVTYRFRLDKNNFAVRRNEVDAAIGTRRTYLEAGYIRLNRDITSGVEDLRDVEEIRLGARVAFARYWSMFGSTNVDLTGKSEDPTSQLNGFEPVRHRLGIAYEDDCVEMGFTWRRDYQTVGDARAGNSFQLRLVFKNLGM